MRKLLLVVAGLAMAGSAGAEGIEVWFLAGQTLMSNGGLGSASCVAGELCIGGSQNDISLTDGFHFGFRGGFNTGDHLGYEMGYMYNRTSLDVLGEKTGMAYHQVMFNALYYITNPDARFRPFATGGAGFTNYAQPGTSAAYGGGTTQARIQLWGRRQDQADIAVWTALRCAPGHHAQTVRFAAGLRLAAGDGNLRRFRSAFLRSSPHNGAWARARGEYSSTVGGRARPCAAF